ncbi:probable protein phosphatase 2C 26 isoform X1 [Carica papaya]|uniref:probable protein phosphatase 2C 26 isoform X1 n=3 Tax=Carica papaya TaxID=3649 RepID=UPI000B8CCB48|nr:probable protein phosphatase 2C 26 isoform X1 [Carica papaya]
MAVPVFRIGIPESQQLCAAHLHSPRLPNGNSIPRKSTQLFCTSSQELNPVRCSRSQLSFCVGTYLIPHPNKVERGGEDAFFVSGYKGGVIAVADGVSGWAEQNVDPSLFSRELMANASYLVGDEEVQYDPRILIRKAHAATSSTGSATVIIAMLEENGIIKIANVGDCGLRVLREGHIIFSTSPQEHYFDCPYQLSSETFGQTYLDAMVSNLELIEGDAVVMGSDGLFDNVFDHEIISTMGKPCNVAEAAKALANLASYHSTDTNFDSPYSIEARTKGLDVPWWKKILGNKLIGGKLDDITVIVGQVVSSSASTTETIEGNRIM